VLTTNSDGVPVLEPVPVIRRRFILSLGFFGLLGVLLALLYNSGSTDKVLGGGSTFAQPLIERLSGDYRNHQSSGTDWTLSSAAVEYEPVGSLGGILRLKDPEVDFALVDYPLSETLLKDVDAFQFPIAIGSISPAYNLKTQGSPQLNMSATLLSAMFRGEVKSWNDAAISAENPGVKLPDLPIKIAHRSDGSGTTLNFTTYLSASDPSWKGSVGLGTEVKWPLGEAVRGSSKMTAYLSATEGSIGYLETGQAKRAGLQVAALQDAALQDAAGQFVLPERDAVWAGSRAALAAYPVTETVGAPAADAKAYPLTSVVYAIVKTGEKSRADRDPALRFFAFLLEQGDSRIEDLGYLALPQPVAASIILQWKKRFEKPAST
jgi:phosphate transport system substrate-binding protein